MIRKTLIFLLLATTAFVGILANDGIYYTRGNHLVPLMETDISVRKEVLTISLNDNGYAQVDVYYEFWNPASTAKRLLMGFEADPPYNDDYTFHPSGVHPNIKDFSVEMNGIPLPYRNAACLSDTNRMLPIDITKKYHVFANAIVEESKYDIELDEPKDWNAAIGYSYVYYFYADFQPGLNNVHHRYSYKLSKLNSAAYLLEYKLSPAGRWAGSKIDDFTLTIRAENTAKHFFISKEAFPDGTFQAVSGSCKMRQREHLASPCTEVSLRNGAITLHLSDFRPQKGKELTLISAEVYEMTDSGRYNFAASYDRSNDIFLKALDFFDSTHITPTDTTLLKRIARNLPYAHRGHVFRDPFLEKHFEGLWWYMPDTEYKDSDADFTDVDREYIRLGKECPSFPGGDDALYQYFAENIKLNNECFVTGYVVITFTVETDGSITNPKIRRDLGCGTGAEVKRVLEGMPRWIPGIRNGIPVKSEISLPVLIAIQQAKSKHALQQ